MKKRKLLIIVAGVILTTGLLLYFSKATLKPVFESKISKSQSLEHIGHVRDIPDQKPQKQVEEEPPLVEIPFEKQQLIGVKTEEVSIKSLQKTIRTVGRIEYDERKLYTVNTKFEGWIEKLYINYTGRYVAKGEPLAEIYSPEVITTQQEFLNALKWAKYNNEQITKDNAFSKKGMAEVVKDMLSKDANAILDAAKKRMRLWDITDEQIRKIEETGNPLRTLTIYSPVSGYIIQKMALQGMRVMPGEKLFDVADLSTVWIIADIYEYELPLINIGQKANISISYFPDKEFSSVIDYMYPALSGETRTVKVRFTIPNPEGKLKPQMFTNVEIKVNIGRKLVIPEDAVIDTGFRQIVYVDKKEGYFEPREIQTGLRVDGMIEVIKGLKAGERVVSEASFLIDSEAQLKGIKPLERNPKSRQ